MPPLATTLSRAASHKLSLSSLRILLAVHRGITIQTEIGRHLNLTTACVGNSTTNLIARKLLGKRRLPTTDQRSISLHLTRQGRTLIHSLSAR